MKGQVRNRAYPVGSLAEHITAYERYTFASRYLRGVQTRLNRQPWIQNEDLYFGGGYDTKYPRWLLNKHICMC